MTRAHAPRQVAAHDAAHARTETQLQAHHDEITERVQDELGSAEGRAWLNIARAAKQELEVEHVGEENARTALRATAAAQELKCQVDRILGTVLAERKTMVVQVSIPILHTASVA